MCSLPFYINHSDGLCLKEHKKGQGRPRNQMGKKTLLDLDYADDLSILDESVRKINEILEVMQVKSARIGLKINIQKSKSLWQGISEDETVTFGNEKTDPASRFAYLGSIITKEGGSSEDVKSRISKAQAFFHS